MPFAVIKRGIFGPKVIHLGITRRKPPAHLLDAGLASLGSGVCRSSGSTVRGILGSVLCGRSRSKIRASFNVLFVK